MWTLKGNYLLSTLKWRALNNALKDMLDQDHTCTDGYIPVKGR